MENTKTNLDHIVSAKSISTDNYSLDEQIERMTREMSMVAGDPQALQKAVKSHIVEIFSMIEQQTRRIEKAQSFAQEANNISQKDTWVNWLKQRVPGSILGINIEKERAILMGEALVATNEAVAETNKLIQRLVVFICGSIEYARLMATTMAGILTKGFEDKDGHIIRLSEHAKEVTQILIQQAQDYIQKETIYEERQKNQEKDIEENRFLIEENTEKLNKIFSVLDDKSNIDERQEQRLDSIQEALERKREVDSKQEEQIQKNTQDIAELQKTKGSNKLVYTISISALVLSVVSIALQFIR